MSLRAGIFNNVVRIMYYRYVYVGDFPIPYGQGTKISGQCGK